MLSKFIEDKNAVAYRFLNNVKNNVFPIIFTNFSNRVNQEKLPFFVSDFNHEYSSIVI